MAGVVIPLGEEVLSVCGVQITCRAGTAIVPAGEPEDKRPAVVMGVADAAAGTVRVATGPDALRQAVRHPCSRVPGLSETGWLSGGADIACELSVPGSAWAGLDGWTFAGCDAGLP